MIVIIHFVVTNERIKTTPMEDVSTGVLNCICQNKKKYYILSIMSYLQPNCCFEIDLQKVDQHAGGKWLIHDTKRRKYNQLQSLKLPCGISKLSS